jgi:hypothetical protein
MKKVIYILMAIYFLGVTSCVKPFDPDYDLDPVIYLEGYPGADNGMVMFKIMPAYSKSNKAVAIPFRPDITFSVNDEVIATDCIDQEEGFYTASCDLKPGDNVRISVFSDGFTPAHAETVIPEAFPERKIDYGVEQLGDDTCSVVRVTIDKKNRAYAYGVQVCTHSAQVIDGEYYEDTYRYAGNLYPTDFEYSEMSPMNLEAIDIQIRGEYLWAWEARMLDKGPNTFSIQTYDDLYISEGDIVIYDEYGNEASTYHYIRKNKLVLYSMSEEFYKYRVAYEYQRDYSGFTGFIAPSNYCYSNVENGFGVFAGVNVIETDWITEEFIENNR